MINVLSIMTDISGFLKMIKADAIYMEAKWKVDGEIKSLVMAVPYQKKKFLRKLKIYKPKIVRSNNIDDKTLDRGLEEFRNGISKHEKGAEVWNKFIDQSR